MLNINILPYYDIPPKKEIDLSSFSIIGEGEKHILICVQINKEEVKWTKENEDLNKILSAIKLTEKDYILYKGKDFSGLELNNVQNINKIQKIIFFGLDSKTIFNGFHCEYLQIATILNFEVLAIPSLENLMHESNKIMKAKLWGVLQDWFKLNKST